MHFLNKVKLAPLFSVKMSLTPPPLAHSGSATDTGDKISSIITIILVIKKVEKDWKARRNLKVNVHREHIQVYILGYV